MEVEVSQSSQARYARPPAVAMVAGGEDPQSELYLAHLPDGPIMVFAGVAAALYRGVVAGEGPVTALATALAVDEAEVDAESVEELLTEWVEQGYLMPHPTSPQPS